MGKLSLKKVIQSEQCKALLGAINNKRKLSIGLGTITIVSGMLLSSGCSKTNEDFDPNKCQIKAEHKHLCTWEEMREDPDKGEILTKFEYWCKDSEIEALSSEYSSSNFKVEGHKFIIEPKELEDFDPSKCEIEEEHSHMCTGINIIEITVDEEGNRAEKIRKLDRWCTDEEIKLEQENDPDFKVFDEYMIYINPEKEELDTNKVLVNIRR